MTTREIIEMIIMLVAGLAFTGWRIWCDTHPNDD